MGKELLVGLATLSLSIAVSGAQRSVGGGMPVAAPAPAMHAMPAAAPAHVPVVAAGNHMVTPTHPVSSVHAPVRTGSIPVHPVMRGSTPAPKPVARPVRPTSGVPTRAGTPMPQTGFAPGFLPSDAFNGSPCFPGNCNPAPGLGFDFPHFFAVHPNFGRFQSHFAGVIVPGWGGGFYFPVPYYTEAAPQEEVQQEPAAASAEQQQATHEAASAPVNEQLAPMANRSYDSTPTKPVEEYVFVKRDGTRIFAVAYSLTADKIQYVSREGLRRTVSLDALDYDATMKSNEERGNTVTLPGVPPAAMAMLR